MKVIGKKSFLSIAVIFIAVYLRKYGVPGKTLAPLVETKYGLVQGKVAISRNGREYYGYYGIPYARQPVQELRFEPPVEVEKWEGKILDATEYGPKCIQFDLMANTIIGDESCLFLNIFTPKRNVSDGKLLPVLFFIHGGLFIFGGGDLYQPNYFMDEEAILVTINYRLASFGFLNTGDGEIRGNMGLKDQNLALRFVKENIRNFGGDPDRVTIFGESAGAASCHFHQISPMSKGLFSKIISQSGLAVNPWALTKDPVSQSKKFATNLGCNSDNSKEMVSCLKNLTALEVVSGHFIVADPLRELIDVFVPTIELNIPDGNTFLSEDPLKLLQEGKINKVPSIIGFNSDEGLLNSAIITRNETLVNKLRQDMEKFLPRLLYLEDNTNSSLLNQLKDYYYLSEPKVDSITDLKNYTAMFTDRFWLTDLEKAVKYQSKLAPVYLYYYTYPAEFTLTEIVLAMKGEFHPILEIMGMTLRNLVRKYILWEKLPNFGICHSDELSLQFYMPMLSKISQEDPDYGFSMNLVRLWVDFAKADISIDNGAGELEFLGAKWPPQDPSQPLKYFQLDSKPALIPQPRHSAIKFWNSLGVIKN